MPPRAPAVADNLLCQQLPVQAQVNGQIAARAGAIVAVAQHTAVGADLHGSIERRLDPQWRPHLFWMARIFDEHHPAAAPIKTRLAVSLDTARTQHHWLPPRNRGIARQRQIGIEPLHGRLNPLALDDLRK